ncbi:hypothetical protein [Frigidibacter sp. ROC022]|uniref:hypothetical protein n=1 Tax=Frigidibacter sp. ROC022 TaxID=2971796 RepID=UPI00215AC77D|nr:hypothetical protein [Frigidibacter sp. ROC022]MCR8724049.1 hypothetical protein [Frigidibacter sp. ROC022]
MTRASILAVLGTLTLTACGPMSPAAAARVCEERARAATGVHGSYYVGVSTAKSGPVVGGELSVSSDYLQGRDPYDVYDQCVREKSGQGPIRPLDLG